MWKREAKVEETFLIVKEDGPGDQWTLKLIGESQTKEEAFERVKGGVALNYEDYFVIPAYRAELDSVMEIPTEFADVEPKGELPNPIASSQADGDPAE